jgi:hypothetical protein
VIYYCQVLGYRKERDDLNEAYHQKLEENERAAEERTAKKRKKEGTKLTENEWEKTRQNLKLME